MQRIPFFPTLGNHDVNQVGASNWASSAEIKMFLLPRNGTEQERYYSFDTGDVHFVVLDSTNCCGSTQTTWLANDLAATTRKWKFVSVRNTWGPIFDQFGTVFDTLVITKGALPTTTTTTTTANTSGWRYRSRTGSGIVKVKLTLSRSTPGGLRFTLKGVNGSWPATPADLPLRATLVLDTPNATTGQCGEATFPGPSPACSLTGSGSTLRRR